MSAWPAAAQVTAVSSADYQTPVAPASLVTLFGANPATTTAAAQLDSSGQLPVQVAGVSVQVAGQAAQLLYVSPSQINLVMPASLASGTAAIEVTGSSTVRTTVEVRNAAPALFSADSSGRGAGSILNGVTFVQGPFLVETAANLGDDKRTRLAIYGTGIRYAGNPFLDPSVTNAAGAVTAQAMDRSGNVYTLAVEYAGAAPVYFGLDQVNVVLPPQLDGLGTLSLTLSTAAASSNVVTFTVDPLPAESIRLVGLRLAASSVLAGSTVAGTVTLNAPARSGGFPVALATSANFVQTVSSLTVPEGSVEAEFTIQTSSNGAGPSTVTASANGVSRVALLTVNSTSAPTLSAIAVSSASVVGGNPVTGTVMLSGAAPSDGVSIQLATDSTYAQPPASVTVGFGQKSATFTIATNSVTAAQTVKITASYNGTSQPATLTVNPVFTFALGTEAVTGGHSATATATLGAPAPAGGATVTFSSSDLLAATVSPFLSIASGQTSATVTISTTAVAAIRTVTITATYRSTPVKVQLTVLPTGTPVLSSIVLTPTSIKGGNSVTGTASLTLAAPQPSGTTVVLASSNKLVAQLPASVTVPAGQTSVKFLINTTAVSSAQAVTISGSAGGVTRNATLAVQ